MRVFVLSEGQDTGGQGARIAAALRGAGHTAHAMHQSETYLKYPRDERWDEGRARALFEAADVVHLKNGVALYEQFGGDKSAVVHHQGTRLRDNAAAVDAECRAVGAVQIVSTVDLLADCTDATWIPSPHDLDWMRDKYRTRGKGVAHAPTNRAAKGTGTVIEVCGRMGLTLDLIEGVEWRVCLSRKGRAEILIDQLTIGYGNNAVEAMALGVPVISGWAEEADRQTFHAQTHMAELPFVHANDAESLETALGYLSDPDARADMATRGRAFVEEFHSYEAVVARLLPVYEQAVNRWRS